MTATSTAAPIPLVTSVRRSRRTAGRTWWVYIVLVIGCAGAMVPLVIMVLTAFKTDLQTYSSSALSVPAPFTLENFANAIGAQRILPRLGFTALVALTATAGQLIFSTLAAYAFARLPFRGRDALFWSYLSTLMVPNVVTIIPLFVLVQRLGLGDSFVAIVLPTLLGSPFGVFLMRQFFLTLPKDLEAAASIDGAGVLRTFVSVILPLSRPILATLALMTLVQGWNNYMWPLLISSSETTRVITVAIAGLSSNYGVQIGTMMAISVLATLPLMVIYLFFQKQLIQSIALTGFK